MAHAHADLLVIFMVLSLSSGIAARHEIQAGTPAQELQARADAAFDSSDWETAVVAYQALLDNDPQGPPELEALRDSGRYAAALVALTPCSGPEYRQFDFWVGSWEVYAPNGQVVGRNVIEPILEGCGLREMWTSAAGTKGQSANFYDSVRGRWHQTWIDDSGNPLYLDGGLEDGRMVLGDGTNRITWTPLPNGNVRQHWETTADGGETWATAFDGEYRPTEGR